MFSSVNPVLYFGFSWKMATGLFCES